MPFRSSVHPSLCVASRLGANYNRALTRVITRRDRAEISCSAPKSYERRAPRSPWKVRSFISRCLSVWYFVNLRKRYLAWALAEMKPKLDAELAAFTHSHLKFEFFFLPFVCVENFRTQKSPAVILPDSPCPVFGFSRKISLLADSLPEGAYERD
jgi:hypothetical protein